MIKMLKWIFALSLLLSPFIAIASFRLDTFNVHGNSMFPALNHGDACITYSTIFGQEIFPQRGDIVTIDRWRVYFIKRIIGVPGDKIQINNDLVIINGKAYRHPAVLLEVTHGDLDITLADDEYFVLGDNRAASKDSRSFGPVKRDDIVGKVWLRWRTLTEL